jgi:DNA-directed RNA polymerase II subunit RPB2
MNHSDEDIITKDLEDLILEKTLKSFYQTNFHSSLQLESFNHFVNYKLPQILEDESVIQLSIDNSNYRIVFSNVFLEKPQIVDDDYRRRNLLPLEARIRDLTYAGNLVANINTCKVSIDETTGEEIISEYICHAKKVICKIPIMLFSSKCHLSIDTTTVDERVSKGECRYDHGGYFLIKGRERVLVTQERLNYNTIYCFEHKLGKYNTISEIRSMSEQTRHSTYIQMKMCRRNIVITLPYINIDVSIGVVFQAYGFSKKEIESLFLLHLDSSYLSYLELILLDMIKIRNQQSAIRFLSEHSTSMVKLENRSHFVEQLLHNEIFPHLGLISSKYCKAIFLMKMIKKVILTKENKIRYDRKDNISCKRFEIAGTLIGDLFRTLFKRFSRGVVKQIEKKIDESSIHVILSKINTIQNGLYSSFATGNWGIVKSSFIRMGVSQILSRFTNASMKSHLRRVITPVGKEGKNVKIRQLDSSTFGFLDPIETPEGQATGITKNMTTFVKSSLHYNSSHIKSIIETMRDVQTDFCYLVNCDENKDNFKPTFIYLNGNLIGYTFQSDSVFQKIKIFKTKKILKEDISISREKESGEIIIFSDDGRLLRPLFQTKKKPTMKDIHEKTFDILVEEGFIQYLDCYELENSLVAMNYDEALEKEADYFEIHPTFMNACTTNLIPFPDHTQSPRNCYWSSMSKQALSKYCSNISNRVDTINYSLSYPEAPILDTHHSINDENQNTAFGSNLIVAIACFTGFNQEDSVIINKSAIDRGLLRAFSYRILTCEEKKKNTISCEKIQQIPAILQNPSFDYSKLDKNGIIKVGSFVSIGTVLVGKIKRNNVKKITNKDDILQCASIICKAGEEGYVDKTIITSNSEGYRLVKLKIRNEKIPEIGDKVCSRNAQKVFFRF